MYKVKNPRKAFDYAFFAMVIACVVYSFLGYLIASHPNHPPLRGMETLKAVLAIVAAATIIIGLQLPRSALTDEKLLAKGSKQAAMSYVFSNAYTSFAMLQAVAVYGILWTIISLEIKHLPITSGLAIIAIVYQRTRIVEYFDKAEQLFPSK